MSVDRWDVDFVDLGSRDLLILPPRGAGGLRRRLRTSVETEKEKVSVQRRDPGSGSKGSSGVKDGADPRRGRTDGRATIGPGRQTRDLGVWTGRRVTRARPFLPSPRASSGARSQTRVPHARLPSLSSDAEGTGLRRAVGARRNPGRRSEGEKKLYGSSIFPDLGPPFAGTNKERPYFRRCRRTRYPGSPVPLPGRSPKVGVDRGSWGVWTWGFYGFYYFFRVVY